MLEFICLEVLSAIWYEGKLDESSHICKYSDTLNVICYYLTGEMASVF